MKRFILGSGSPRRKELLSKEGYTFEIIKSSVDEILNPKLSPRDNAMELSKQKAQDIAKKEKGVILAADTIVVIKNEIIGKPKDHADAVSMLKKLSGAIHEVITGFTVMDTATQKECLGAVSTYLKFKPITEEEIEAYLLKDKPYDKAGSYAVQQTGDQFVDHIEGSYTNVVGLPIDEVKVILKEFGISPVTP